MKHVLDFEKSEAAAVRLGVPEEWLAVAHNATATGPYSTGPSATIRPRGYDRMVDSLVGRTLEERFQILTRLGRGGMGTVYVARDAHLRRQVVVKVPHASLLARPKNVRRFHAEAWSLAKLDHPNIVRVLHASASADLPFLVMEYMPGGTLLGRLERGLRPDPRLWLAGIASALDYIHARRVVHRDVKPGNILFDDKERACLADFGLIGIGRGPKAVLDEATQAPGSMGYAAPEQLAGDRVTPAADQYALASILYEVFAGQVPFGRSEPLVLLQRKFSEDPPALALLAPELTESACAVILRGMARNPRDRFRTCGDLATAFDEARVRTRATVPVPRRSSRWVRAHGTRWAAVALFTVTAAVVLLLVGPLLQPRQPPPLGASPSAAGPVAVTTSPLVAPEAEPAPGSDLKALFEMAKREERAGRYESARSCYESILSKAPAGTPAAAQAQAAKSLLDERTVTAKETTRPTEGVHEELWRRLADFDIDGVRRDAERLFRTRTASPERNAIEATLARAEYIERLLAIVGARAKDLSGEDAKWATYDPSDAKGLTVVGADAEGIRLREGEAGPASVKRWGDIVPIVRLAFIDSLRHRSAIRLGAGRSVREAGGSDEVRRGAAREALWLGVYCQVSGEDLEGRYFEYAVNLDPSPGMRALVSALKLPPEIAGNMGDLAAHGKVRVEDHGDALDGNAPPPQGAGEQPEALDTADPHGVFAKTYEEVEQYFGRRWSRYRSPQRRSGGLNFSNDLWTVEVYFDSGGRVKGAWAATVPAKASASRAEALVRFLRGKDGQQAPRQVGAADINVEFELGETEGLLGRPVEAEPVLRATLAMNRRLFPDQKPRLANSMAALGFVLLQLGRFDEAEPVLRECLVIRQQLYADDHPEVWLRHHAAGLLGGALVGQARDIVATKPAKANKMLVAAALLLISSTESILADSRVPVLGPESDRKREALVRVIDMYDVEHRVKPGQGYDRKAVEWRQRLTEYDASSRKR